jgi:hypothetical protein
LAVTDFGPRPYSPFDHALGEKPRRFPGRWSCIIGDVYKGYERVSLLIWGQLTMMGWALSWLVSSQFWMNAGTPNEVINSAGRLYAELSGLLVLVAFLMEMWILGFGKVKG